VVNKPIVKQVSLAQAEKMHKVWNVLVKAIHIKIAEIIELDS